MISRQVGRGTYVSELVQTQPFRGGEEGTTPAEMMEFPLVIEPSLIELVVLTPTERQLDGLSNITMAGRRVRVWQEAEDVDRRFIKHCLMPLETACSLTWATGWQARATAAVGSASRWEASRWINGRSTGTVTRSLSPR